MKLLTLNTHSLVEPSYERKLHLFVSGIAQLEPDIIALQEVSQSQHANPLSAAACTGYHPAAENSILTEDNHLYRVVKLLHEQGIDYHWTWLPIKHAYGTLCEGIGLMSRSPIITTQAARISRTDDFCNWQRRMLLGIQTERYGDTLFYSTHMSRWDDREEPFLSQWEATQKHLAQHKTIWLMGDFNNPADVRREGYDCMTRSGWYDAYLMAKLRDSGNTVIKPIDGWRDRNEKDSGMRIDQIWCSRHAEVIRSEVVFNGIHQPVVSDHYGVMITVSQYAKGSVY